MDNKICNVKVEVPSGIQLNDKDYIAEFNSCLKDMIKNYAISMTEASNQKLFEAYKDIYLKLSFLQRKAYKLMFKNGWYCLEVAQGSKVNQKFNTLSKEYNDIFTD